MEQTILEALDYNVMIPTVYAFLSIYLYIDNAPESVRTLAVKMIVKVICNYEMMKYKPSIIASATMYLAKKQLAKAPYWSLKLNTFTSYKVRDIMKCIDEIKKDFYQGIP